jgi:catalase
MSDPQAAPTTTSAGIPVESDEHSLTIGPDGPILLHDHYLISSRSSTASECPSGSRTPRVLAHSGGSRSPTTSARIPRRQWCDPRGFALKFYTTEGNYDIVGNDTPVFFLRDPLKFPSFIRSQKRRADNNLRDHDMQWDFGPCRQNRHIKSPS